MPGELDDDVCVECLLGVFPGVLPTLKVEGETTFAADERADVEVDGDVGGVSREEELNLVLEEEPYDEEEEGSISPAHGKWYCGVSSTIGFTSPVDLLLPLLTTP